MLAVLGSDFVRTARASGLAPRTVVFTYAFRNAVLPVITTLGMVFSFLLGANVLVEKVFAWPGIGLYAVEALIASDYAPVQGFVLTMAILYVAAQSADRPRSTAWSIRACGWTHDRDLLRHARYVLSENPVTGLAFGLFALLLVAALFGPSIAPYDAAADQRRRGAASRRRRRTGSAPTSSAATSSAACWWRPGSTCRSPSPRWCWPSCWARCRAWPPAISAAGPISVVGRLADTIMAFPLFVLAMGIVAALGNEVINIVIATAIINLPLYARVARAEANVRREAGFVEAARLSGNGEARILLGHVLPNIMPIMMVQMSLTMGYAILNAAGLSFIGLGVRPPDAGMGHHGRRGRQLHPVGRMVDRAVSRRRADAGGVLLQPAGRRPARHHRSEEADMTGRSSPRRRGPLGRVPHPPGTVQGAGAASASRSTRARPSALVGESGSGKSVTAFAIMGILDPAGRVTSGRAMFGGSDLLALAERELAEHARARALDDLPEPAHGAQSDPPASAGRSPTCWCAMAARRAPRRRGRRSRC